MKIYYNANHRYELPYAEHKPRNMAQAFMRKGTNDVFQHQSMKQHELEPVMNYIF